MRNALAIVLVIHFFAACGSSKDEALEAAKKQQEEEARKNPPPPPPDPAKKESERLPVPMDIQVPCTQLLDPAAMQAALGEKDPVTITDQSKTNKDSTSTCSVVRGGKRPSKQEMDALLKKSRRLGVLAGDTICSITTFCSLLENEKHFEEHCKEVKDEDNQEIGQYACVHVVAQGADDVNVYKFLDEDTRCVVEVRGGPSMVENGMIAKCAQAAKAMIGPDQIKLPAK
ncbi:MAG TPA: hypothetical protein VL463_11440 [Kofleriaceae bacterium]|nr:hypothetical protein [Kofleriaceae bacterium]